MLARLRSLDDEARFWLIVGAIGLAVAVPMVLAGPGTDLDVANVFRSGRAIAMHLSYVPSRPPGSPVHEAIVGVLDLIGGPTLAAAASVVAAAALVWTLDRLLAGEGLGTDRRWGLLVLVANPWFVVAATSAADYVFALLFVALGARALRTDRPMLAGLLLAAAMGSRIGSATLLLGLLVAEVGEGAEGRRRLVRAAPVAVAATLVAFIPSAVAAGGLSFAQNDFSASSPLVQLGRAMAKDLLLLGLPSVLVILATAIPSIASALRSWRTSWLVRFATVGLVASQVLFVRFPWKVAHLLPSLLCLVLLLTVAIEGRPKVLVALVALQVVFGLVRLDVIAPDQANEATGGRIHPTITSGPVVRDWRCRRDHPGVERGRQIDEVEKAWDCSAPFRD